MGEGGQFLYGPPGCGKTFHSVRIAAFLGLHHIIDGADPYQYAEAPADTLVIINASRGGALDFHEVMKKIEESEEQ